MRFRRTRNTGEPTPTEPAAPTSNFDPIAYRDRLFTEIGKRAGGDSQKIIEQDFYNHISKDPVNGVEAGYLCLLGKLIDYIDELKGIVDQATGISGANGPGVSDFTVYRKP